MLRQRVAPTIEEDREARIGMYIADDSGMEGIFVDIKDNRVVMLVDHPNKRCSE